LVEEAEKENKKVILKGFILGVGLFKAYVVKLYVN